MSNNMSQMPDRKPDSVEILFGGKHIVGTMGADGKMQYDHEKIKSVVQEMIAGQSGKTSGHFNTTAQVVYRYETSRKTHHDNMWT